MLLKYVAETVRNENRRFLRDTVVKTFGKLYNDFLPTKICNVQENRVREAHEVATRQGGVPRKDGRALHPHGGLVSFQITSCFPKFLNIPKWRKIAFRIVLSSVYLPYHIPITFWSLERSGKCPLCIPPGLRSQ